MSVFQWRLDGFSRKKYISLYLYLGLFVRKPEKLGSHTGSKWWPGDPDSDRWPKWPIDPVTQWPSSMSGVYCVRHSVVGSWRRRGRLGLRADALAHVWLGCTPSRITTTSISSRRPGRTTRQAARYMARCCLTHHTDTTTNCIGELFSLSDTIRYAMLF